MIHIDVTTAAQTSIQGKSYFDLRRRVERKLPSAHTGTHTYHIRTSVRDAGCCDYSPQNSCRFFRLALGFPWPGSRVTSRNWPGASSLKQTYPCKRDKRRKIMGFTSSLSYNRSCSWSRNDLDRFTSAIYPSCTCADTSRS